MNNSDVLEIIELIRRSVSDPSVTKQISNIISEEITPISLLKFLLENPNFGLTHHICVYIKLSIAQTWVSSSDEIRIQIKSLILELLSSNIVDVMNLLHIISYVYERDETYWPDLISVIFQMLECDGFYTGIYLLESCIRNMNLSILEQRIDKLLQFCLNGLNTDDNNIIISSCRILSKLVKKLYNENPFDVSMFLDRLVILSNNINLFDMTHFFKFWKSILKFVISTSDRLPNEFILKLMHSCVVHVQNNNIPLNCRVLCVVIASELLSYVAPLSQEDIAILINTGIIISSMIITEYKSFEDNCLDIIGQILKTHEFDHVFELIKSIAAETFESSDEAVVVSGIASIGYIIESSKECSESMSDFIIEKLEISLSDSNRPLFQKAAMFALEKISSYPSLSSKAICLLQYLFPLLVADNDLATMANIAITEILETCDKQIDGLFQKFTDVLPGIKSDTILLFLKTLRNGIMVSSNFSEQDSSTIIELINQISKKQDIQEITMCFVLAETITRKTGTLFIDLSNSLILYFIQAVKIILDSQDYDMSAISSFIISALNFISHIGSVIKKTENNEQSLIETVPYIVKLIESFSDNIEIYMSSVKTLVKLVKRFETLKSHLDFIFNLIKIELDKDVKDENFLRPIVYSIGKLFSYIETDSVLYYYVKVSNIIRTSYNKKLVSDAFDTLDIIIQGSSSEMYTSLFQITDDLISAIQQNKIKVLKGKSIADESLDSYVFDSFTNFLGDYVLINTNDCAGICNFLIQCFEHDILIDNIIITFCNSIKNCHISDDLLLNMYKSVSSRLSNETSYTRQNVIYFFNTILQCNSNFLSYLSSHIQLILEWEKEENTDDGDKDVLSNIGSFFLTLCVLSTDFDSLMEIGLKYFPPTDTSECSIMSQNIIKLFESHRISEQLIPVLTLSLAEYLNQSQDSFEDFGVDESLHDSIVTIFRYLIPDDT